MTKLLPVQGGADWPACYAVGDMREQIGPQHSEQRLEHGYGDEADDQYVKRAFAVMHQGFVDDDLKEQWRDQREQLQKEENRKTSPISWRYLPSGEGKTGRISRSTSSDLSLARQVFFIAKSILRLHAQKLRFAR
jgi:hypothetical protein